MTTTPRTSWAKVPASPSPGGIPQSLERALRLLGSVLVAGLGPVVRTAWISPAYRTVVVAVAAVVAVLLVATVVRSNWVGRAAVAAAAGAIAIPCGGAWVGLWLALSITLASWVVLGNPPHPSMPRSHDVAIAPVAVLSLVAAYQGRELFNRYLPVAITVGCFAITWLTARHAQRVGAATRAVGHWAGVGASRALFTLLGIVVVLIPWVTSRLAVVDPLAAPTRRGSSWLPRTRNHVERSRPWSGRTLTVRPSRFVQVRSALASTVVVVALVGLAFVVMRDPEPLAGTVTDDRPAAYAGVSWWPDYLAQMNWIFFEPGPAYNPLRYPLMGEAHTPYINIEEGERRTWSPPPCACEPLTVWMYGGSTMVGMGQRDDFTIASEVAKLAAADGITLDIRNRGVLGDLHWEEAQRFAWDVEAQQPPDLVIFYSGANDIVGTQYRDGLGRGLDGTPVDWTAEDAYAESDTLFGPFRAVAVLFTDEERNEQWTAPGPQDVEPKNATELGAFVGAQYAKAREMGRHAADAHGVTAHWFWQPSRYTRPQVESEPRREASYDAFQREAFRSAARSLPPGVHDISGVYRASDEPYFYDDVHTNEPGAQIVAREMYERIRPDLDRLRQVPA